VLSLTLGGRHACARYNGGYVRCWGNNEAGQLGLGHAEFQGDLKPYQLTNADRSALAGPIDLGGPAIDVKAGYDFTCALLADQTVRCWGLNDQGQLGLGNTTAQKTSTPNTLGAINVGGAAVAISVGDSSTCVILSGGALRCWGYNDSGMLGLGNTSTPSTTTTPNLIPTVNLGSANAAYVAVGADDTCVILTNGTIRCFGDNFFGELGMGTGGDPSSTETPSLYGPVALPSADTAAAITAGTNFACARLSSGLAECWGRNMAGQLGIGTTSNVGDNEPATAGVVQTGGKSTSAIAVGTGHTCAILGGGGGLRCWGDNGKGELGYADKNPRGTTSGTVPGSILAVSFGGTLSANAVFVGNLSTCALLSSGEVRCWGWNNYGQLGLGFVSGTSTDYVGGDSAHTPDVVLATSVQLLPP
jgi:alpha-tubulin suppressor-like RCC1 family protein